MSPPRDAGTTSEPALPSWFTKRSTSERPPTPRVEAPTDAVDVDAAVILLQRLLRGRSVQNTIIHGKEVRMDLIRELREADALEPESEAEVKEKQRAADVRLGALDSTAGQTVAGVLTAVADEAAAATGGNAAH